jgi:hypothetical protein
MQRNGEGEDSNLIPSHLVKRSTKAPKEPIYPPMLSSLSSEIFAGLLISEIITFLFYFGCQLDV